MVRSLSILPDWTRHNFVFPMKLHYSPSPAETNTLGTEALREQFLITGLSQRGQVTAHYTDLDRMIVGIAAPASTPLTLPDAKETGTAFFLERREIGILNLGAPGAIRVGGERYSLNTLDCLYIGLGEREVAFENGAAGGAEFYFISTPAHAKYPTKLATRAQAEIQELGMPRSPTVVASAGTSTRRESKAASS